MRGHLDAAEYKHIVLGLIFLRFLSTTDDVPLKQMAFVLKEEAVSDARKNGHGNGSLPQLSDFVVPEESAWRFICGKAHTATIGRTLDRHHIDRRSSARRRDVRRFAHLLACWNAPIFRRVSIKINRETGRFV